MKATIRRINVQKGFAFAEGEDNRDYFIHFSEVMRSSIAFRLLKEGLVVQGTVKENEDPRKAPKLEGVTLVSLDNVRAMNTETAKV